MQAKIARGDAVGQFRVMSFADYSETSVTPAARQLVGDLHRSDNGEVRFSALSLICTTEDPGLLESLVKDGWTAAGLDTTTQAVEIQNGSRALVLAAAHGLISAEKCLDRIAISEYGLLVEKLGPEAVGAVADRIALSIPVPVPVVGGVLACCNPPCISDRVDLPLAGCRGNDMKNNNR